LCVSLYQNKKLGDDRIKRLKDIGFIWRRISYIPSRSSWEEMFDVLKEYKKDHGHCNVPCDWVENNLKLGVWVSNQRSKYRNNTLSKDRIKRLKDIDLVWNRLGSHWEKMFDTLKEYKKKYGHCNVPHDWVENNLKLGIWKNNQRQSYRKRKLSEDRIKRLDDIGFVWHIHK